MMGNLHQKANGSNEPVAPSATMFSHYVQPLRSEQPEELLAQFLYRGQDRQNRGMDTLPTRQRKVFGANFP
jgi:hypothetical protein